jgi:hypothetical protein
LERTEELRTLAQLWGIECVDYPSTQSFVKEGAFVQVWNEGTLAWSSSIASKFHDLNLSSLRDQAIQFPMSDRGNRSRSFGFTGQSHRRDKTTCVQKPVLRANTKLRTQEMVSLSKLLEVCGGAPPESEYSRQRMGDFAHLIHGDNILEGFTSCITNVSTEEVQCHLDLHNDRLADGFGAVVVASEIKEGERLAGVGYYKNSCASYYPRVYFTKKAISSASRFLDRLDLRRQTLSHAHFPAPQELTLRGFSCRSACMEKAANYSPYVYVFRLLVHTYGLSLSRALESLLPVGWEWVTPESYFRALSDWIESDKLPTENLALAFLRRAAPLAGGGVTYTRIKESLYHLREVIEDVNTSPVLHRHKLHSMVSRLMKLVPGTSKNTCQRLACVAALAGLLRHPALATQACHSPNNFTDLTIGIRDSYGCSTVNQASEVINAVASAMDISRATSESIFSEMLLHTSDSGLDCYFPGQTFFTVEGDRVLQLFPDGTKEYSEPIVCSVDDWRTCVTRLPQTWRTASSLNADHGCPREKLSRTPAKACLTLSPQIPRMASALNTASTGPCHKRVDKRKRTPLTSCPRFTRSATEVVPSKLAILESATPWVTVNLQKRAMQSVGLVGHQSFGERVTYIKTVNCEGLNGWTAVCHYNGSTWDPRSIPSSSYGGVPHNCRHTKEGHLSHINKRGALDHLLLYLCLFCDESEFSWERNKLSHHHFVCLRKEHTVTTNKEPFMILFFLKGSICIGHYKDNWRTRTVLCSA